MPYLPSSEKQALNNGLIEPSTPGHINYCITMLALEYIDRVGESYQHYNDLIGAIESCKLELYRRAVAVYENKKISINGDVFHE